jgi:hypothetical protein
MQRKLTKFKNLKKGTLEKSLSTLYENYSRNEEEIYKLENQVRAINDFEVKHRMSEKKIFENLNHKKPSKTFLDIANAIQKNDNISKILDDTGNAFPSDNERDNYITNFYSELYRRDGGVGGEIEDFLGPEICNNPLVRGSKLTNDEKTALDADLTLDEITKALGESNMRSAPGIDGYSNKFTNKFWYLLKFPYFKCCT